MYNQSDSIFLQRNKYTLRNKTLVVISVHKTENKVKCAIHHIWKSAGLSKKIFRLPIEGWFEIDGKYIEARFQEIGTKGFQSDDCSYITESRGIKKTLMPELIEYLKTVNPII